MPKFGRMTADEAMAVLNYRENLKMNRIREQQYASDAEGKRASIEATRAATRAHMANPEYIQGVNTARGILNQFGMEYDDKLDAAQNLNNLVKGTPADKRAQIISGISSAFKKPENKSVKEIRELAKEEKAIKKEEARLQMAMTKTNLVMGKVDEALGQVGYGTAGFGGAVLGKVPGTSAVDLDETLDTIRANIGFNELAEMRQASPTGGALGQVAVRELELLTSALGSLSRRQSPSQLKSNLKAIKTHYTNWKTAVDEAAQPAGAAATAPKTQAPTNQGEWGIRRIQ